MLLMLLLARRVFYTRRKDEGRVNTLSDVSLFFPAGTKNRCWSHVALTTAVAVLG